LKVTNGTSSIDLEHWVLFQSLQQLHCSIASVFSQQYIKFTMISRHFKPLILLVAWLCLSSAFSIVQPRRAVATTTDSSTILYMSDQERSRSTKKGVSTIIQERTETKAEEQKKKEEMWRVVLHNDEVHTFNYVIRSLCKVVGTLDRKASFEICVQTHGNGKATVTKTWKKQAEQFCLGLQRQGLTVSISPDEDFEGGHSGGGL
jgi:ATP-dependent Clp protease adapter protein ClpS